MFRSRATAAQQPTADRVDGIELAPLLSPADCPRPEARALLSWWQALPRRSPDAMPEWRDVDPVTLRPWIGWICLYDVIDGGRDFRYRLVGTHIADQAGIDLTGRLLSQGVYAATPAALIEHFRRLTRHAAPVWTHRLMETQHGFAVTQDRIWLPFRRESDGDGVAVWMLYVCRLDEAPRPEVTERLPKLPPRPISSLIPVSLNPPALLRL